MSYTLFLLLNVNHEKDGLMEYLGRTLEQTSATSFCLDESPDIFFSVEYLQEGSDSSLVIDIPFGAEEKAMKEVLNFITHLEDYIQFQVLDPQLGRVVKSSEVGQIYDRWKTANRQALESFSDGHYFLRFLGEKDGKKEMVEATRYQEETWQNHCSVAMAYSRIQDAENAQKHFARALELEPENSAIMHALGVTYFNLNDIPKARQMLSAALQSDPENDAARDLLQECEKAQNS